MKLIVPKFSQCDSRWKDVKLGTSTVSTIGGYGCLLTCAAMTCKYFGKDTDPLQLNNDMKRVDGFTNGSFWIWGKLSEVYPDITFDWDVYNEGTWYDIPASLEEIDKLLAEGLPVIAGLGATPTEPKKLEFDGVIDHFVLIVGKEGDYIINDPWTGEEYFFTAKYGDPSRYIFAIRVYRGKVEYEPSCEDQLKDKTAENKNQADQILEQSALIGELEGELDKTEKSLSEETKAKNEARTERDTAISQKDIAEAKVEKLESDITTLQKEKTAITDELMACKKQSISGIGLWEFIKIKFLKRG